MTSRQPSEHLADIKVRFPLWSIRVSGGHGWTGHRGARRVWAATLDDLENELRGAERTITADPAAVLERLRAEHPGWQIDARPDGWAAEHRSGRRLHYVFCHDAGELSDALSRTEP
jgi:hypothetical protein